MLNVLDRGTWQEKCPVASAYVMAISTAMLILDVLNTVWVWRLLGPIFIFSLSLSMEESSVISAVGAILLYRDQLSVTIFFHPHLLGTGTYC